MKIMISDKVYHYKQVNKRAMMAQDRSPESSSDHVFFYKVGQRC